MAELVPLLGPGLALLSGLVLVALAAAVVWLGRRGRAVWLFAAFAALWGLQVVLANLARVWPDVNVARVLWFGFAFTVMLLYVPLFLFVRSYPTRSGVLGRGWGAGLVLALPALAVLVAAAIEPRLLLQEIRVAGPLRTSATFGPLFLPLATANSVFAFAVALFLVHRASRTSSTEVVRLQRRVLEFGFTPYVAFRGAQVLFGEVLAARGFDTTGGLAVSLVTVAMGAAATVSVVWVLVDAVRLHGGRYGSALVVIGTLALIAGTLQAWLPRAGVTGLDTVGLWRFALIAAFAYGIAHFRVFDLERRIGRALPLMAFALASVVGLEVLIDLLGPSIQQRPVAAVAATVTFELGLLGLPHWLRRRWPGLTAAKPVPTRHVEQRRAQVYLATLQSALVDGVITQREDGMLRTLRVQLGIDDAEHARLLQGLGPIPVAGAPLGQ